MLKKEDMDQRYMIRQRLKSKYYPITDIEKETIGLLNLRGYKDDQIASMMCMGKRAVKDYLNSKG